MRSVLTFLARAALLLALVAPVARAQMKVGVVADKVRAELAAAWDTTNPNQPERAFCALYETYHLKSGGVLYEVYGTVPAVMQSADPSNSAYSCPLVANMTTIHTHPPTSCERDGACRFGGMDAYECFPSPTDEEDLRRHDAPFAMIQCDRNAVVSHFKPDAPARARSRLPYVYAGALTAGVVAVKVFRLDPDPGGYRDYWNTSASFPDKAVHAVSAFALTEAGMDMHVRPAVAALLVTGAGVGFEVAQGHVSTYDIAADALGATAAALWRHWHAPTGG